MRVNSVIQHYRRRHQIPSRAKATDCFVLKFYIAVYYISLFSIAYSSSLFLLSFGEDRITIL